MYFSKYPYVRFLSRYLYIVTISGPMSVCIYTSNATRLMQLWRDNNLLRERSNIGVHIVKQGDESFYPMNVLRNIALNQSLTQYVFLTDGDFVPAWGMEENVMQYLPRNNTKQVSKTLLHAG